MDEEPETAGAYEALQQARALEAQKRMVLRKLLSPAAYERMARIRLSSPDRYDQVLATLIQLYQAGQLKSRLSDEALVEIINRLAAQTAHAGSIKVIRK